MSPPSSSATAAWAQRRTRRRAAIAAAFHPGLQLPEWEGYAGYLDHLDAAPASCNVAALVGHGAVRAAVMGGEARAPSDAELDRMRAIVREGVDAGCVGLSTGLIYEPGKHAQTGEIVALAREFAANGGLYATHMRDEGAGLLDSVRESIAIGERAGVPVQISHHKASGRENWGKRARVAASDRGRARARSRRHRGPVSVHRGEHRAGGGGRAYSKAPAGSGAAGAEDVQLSSAPQHPEWEGQTIAALAAAWELSPIDAAAPDPRRRGHRRDRRAARDVRGRRAHRTAPSRPR